LPEKSVKPLSDDTESTVPIIAAVRKLTTAIKIAHDPVVEQ